jgi:orotidine-5'-phosphate decarboxylase
VLERAAAAAREAGALVLLDAKRGDIGSTATAYADAFLRPSSPLCVDAVTVSPYLGPDSLRPFFDSAAEHGRGVFVLALTSNPDGAQVQLARTSSAAGKPAGGAAGTTTVAGAVLASIAAENAGAQPMGSIGAVVGATIGSTTEDLDVNGPLLAPGYGAQGGTVADLHRVFGSLVRRVVPTTSRDVLAAGPDVAALQAAARASAHSVAGLWA